eukprot:6148446-Pleurochrysis_carterae.AAC.1
MLVCASRDGLFYPSCTITVSQHDSSVLFVIGVSGSLIEAVKRSARVAVPESVLKKRKRAEKWQSEKETAAKAAEGEAKKKKEEIFKRAEAYVKEYRDKEEQLITLKRAARKA